MATSSSSARDDETKRCAHCLHEAAGACASCGSVYYCSAECHWLDMHVGEHAGHNLGGHAIQSHLDNCVPLGISTVNEKLETKAAPFNPNAFYRRLSKDNTEIGNVNSFPLLFRALGRAIDIYHTTLSIGILGKIEEGIAKHTAKLATPSKATSIDIDAPTIIEETIKDIRENATWFDSVSGEGAKYATRAANQYLNKFLDHFEQAHENSIFGKYYAPITMICNVFYFAMLPFYDSRRPTTPFKGSVSIFDVPVVALDVISSSMRMFQTIHAQINSAGITNVLGLIQDAAAADNLEALAAILFGVKFSKPFVAYVGASKSPNTTAFFFKTAADGSRSLAPEAKETLVFIAKMAFAKNADTFLADVLTSIFGVAIVAFLRELRDREEKEQAGKTEKKEIDYINAIINGFQNILDTLCVYCSDVLDALNIGWTDDTRKALRELGGTLNKGGQETASHVAVDYLVDYIRAEVTRAGMGDAKTLHTVDMYARLLPLYVQVMGKAVVPQYAAALFEQLSNKENIGELVTAFLPAVLYGKGNVLYLDDEYLWAMLRVVLGNSGALLGKIQQISSEQINALNPVFGRKLFGDGKLKYPSMSPLELYRVADYLGIGNDSILSNYDYQRTVTATIGNIVFLRQHSQPNINVPGILNNYDDLIVKFAKPRTLLLLAFEGTFIDKASEYFAHVTEVGFQDEKEKKMMQKIADTAEQFLVKEYKDLFTEFNFSVEIENTRKFANIYNLAWPLDTSVAKQFAARIGAFTSSLGPYIKVGNAEVEKPKTYTRFPRGFGSEEEAPNRRLLSEMFTYAQSRALGASLETVVNIKQRVREDKSTKSLNKEERTIFQMVENDEDFKIAMIQMFWEWIAKLFDVKTNPEGLFHSDLHPGNIFYYNGLTAPLIMKSGDTVMSEKTVKYMDPNIYVTFIDYGKVGRLNGNLRADAVRILLCIVTILEHAGSMDLERRKAYNEAVDVLMVIVLESLLGKNPDLTNEKIKDAYEKTVELFQSAFYYSASGSELGSQILDVLNSINVLADDIKRSFPKKTIIYSNLVDQIEKQEQKMRELDAKIAHLDKKVGRLADKEKALKERKKIADVQIKTLVRGSEEYRDAFNESQTTNEMLAELPAILASVRSKRSAISEKRRTIYEALQAARDKRATMENDYVIQKYMKANEQASIVNDMATLVRALMAISNSLTAVFQRGLGMDPAEAWKDIFSLAALPIGVAWSTFGRANLRGPMLRGTLDITLMKDTLNTSTIMGGIGYFLAQARPNVPADASLAVQWLGQSYLARIISRFLSGLESFALLGIGPLLIASGASVLGTLAVGYALLRLSVSEPRLYADITTTLGISVDGSAKIIARFEDLPAEWNPTASDRFKHSFTGRGLPNVLMRHWKAQQQKRITSGIDDQTELTK